MILPSGKRLIFIAAENGNVEFLTILIRQYPDLVLKVDDNQYTIFHIAVLNRHEKIFRLIFQLGMMKNLINLHEDADRNNILHLAGKLPPPSRLNIIRGIVRIAKTSLSLSRIIPTSFSTKRVWFAAVAIWRAVSPRLLSLLVVGCKDAAFSQSPLIAALYNANLIPSSIKLN